MKNRPGYIGHLGRQNFDDILAHYAEYTPHRQPSAWQHIKAWLDEHFPANLDQL